MKLTITTLVIVEGSYIQGIYIFRRGIHESINGHRTNL